MKKAVLIFCYLILSITFYAQVHTTYLWHLQQPIYWPEAGQTNPYHYQTVKESNDIKNSGGNQYSTGVSHPTNNLEEIFSNADRVNIYQHRAKETVDAIDWLPEAGAQVNYSGCLIENVNSLANVNQWGYYTSWADNFKTARSWTTSGGYPRLDIVGFTYHHAIGPLITERAFRKELQAHRVIYDTTFGTTPDYTKGYWPAECCFSERNIKVLVEEGFEWSIIANSHLSRTLNDYPLHYGTNGCNISPPNDADKVSTNGTNWWNGQIDGRGGEFAAPYCYQAHKAQYIDPATGTQYLIDVVPMADLLSYRDGYSQQGTGDIQTYIKPYDDASHPSIVLFAHDGDNAWGGGASYYQEAVPNFVNDANNNGIVPTTIQQFLGDHPVSSGDVVHVEDGGWVNAANDWGHPQFINWLWPIYNSTTYEFNPDGWTEDFRNWAVIIAIDNYACMAEDLAGGTDINDIVYPSSSATEAELAWHFYLPALTSGYMYYGTAEDMEVKQTIAGNNSITHAKNVINANSGIDNTPPSVFIPQRFPYNPGGKEFGPIYGYQEHVSSKDFSVWTLAYDVSGIQTIELKYRTDYDGVNAIDNYENDTYTGGSGVTSWQSVSMTKKQLDASYNAGNSDINFFVLPTAIADLYYAEIAGLSDTLVDYYVEATDISGNVFKTPIQHVWVGSENGSGGETSPYLYWTPEDPTKNDIITIVDSQATASSYLHWGLRVGGTDWIAPIEAYWPTGTITFDSHAVQTPFTDPDGDGVYSVEIGPFNNVSQVVDSVCFVVKISESNWDNNNNNDYFIPVSNDVNENPTGGDFSVTMEMNNSHTFGSSEFSFTGVGSATFAGIKIIAVETSGDLEYNSSDVTADLECSDVSLLKFTPAIDVTGNPYATFTFKVIDSEARLSDNTYTCTINVMNYNPLGDDESVTMYMNESYDFSTSDFSFTGYNSSTFAGIKIISSETQGDLDYNSVDISDNQTCADVSLLSFSPATDQTGYPYASFTFKVIDSDGRLSDNTYNFSITVLNYNPLGKDTTVTMFVNETYTFKTTDFDFVGYGGATFDGIKIITIETNGDLEYNTADVAENLLCSDVSLITFTPDVDAIGTPYATFTFKVKDSDGRFSDNNYTFTINVVDSDPISDNSSVTLNQDEVYTFNVSDFPFTGANGATFSGIKLMLDVSKGQLKYNNSAVAENTDYADVTKLTYTPESGEYGTPYTSFNFQVKDSEGRYSDTYTITINVLQVLQTGEISWYPLNPTSNDVITIFVNNDDYFTSNSKFHWGVNDWDEPINGYWPSNSLLYQSTGPQVETQMIQQSSDLYLLQIGPFNNQEQTVNEVNFKIHYGVDSWNDNDGDNWTIPITQVTSLQKANNLKINVYPNPLVNYSTVDMTSETGRYRVSLIDATGKEVTTTEVIAPLKFNLNRGNLQSGIYFLRFQNTETNEYSIINLLIK